MKTKKRYLSYNIVSERSFSKKDFENSFLSVSKQYFGEFGASDLQMQMIKHQDNAGALKVQNGLVDLARAALCLITDINGAAATVSSGHASGTLKRLHLAVSR